MFGTLAHCSNNNALRNVLLLSDTTCFVDMSQVPERISFAFPIQVVQQFTQYSSVFTVETVLPLANNGWRTRIAS